MLSAYFAAKTLKRLMSKPRDLSQYKFEDIAVVTCFVDLKEVPSLDRLLELEGLFPKIDHRFKIVYFAQKETREMPHPNLISLSKKAYSFAGTLKDDALRTLLATKRCLQINYFQNPNPLLLKASLSTTGSFRVGLSGAYASINDLIINTDMSNLSAFKEEMIKYLKIINR